MKKKHIPNLKKIEMDITYRCGLNCNHCNRYVNFDSRPETDVSLDQLDFFLKESKDLDWDWENIRLLGGEPTMHPDFREFVSRIDAFVKDSGRETILHVFTRGKDPFIVGELAWLEENYPNWHIENTNKKSKFQNKFTAVGWAPKDYPEYRNEDYRGCGNVHNCGIGFNYSGFYPAAPCGALAKFFNIEGIKSLELVTEKSLMDMYPRVCSVCGIYHRHKLVKGGHERSQSWRNALNHGPYDLKRYGEDNGN